MATTPLEALSAEDRDLGFGSRVLQHTDARFLNRDGSFNVRRENESFLRSLSLYHEMLTAPEKDLGLVRTFELDSGGQPVTFSAPDEPGVTYTSAAGEFQAAQVASKPGHVLKLPGGKVKFSVMITVKEAK